MMGSFRGPSPSSAWDHVDRSINHSSPAPNQGSRTKWTSCSGLLLQVAAEGETHGREEPVGVLVAAARAEPLEQGRAEHAGGYALVDGRLDGPAPLARVGHSAREVGQIGAVQEGLRRQVEQPGGDDAPAPPDLGDVGDVQVVLVEL